MHIMWGGWNALFEISTVRSFDIWDKLHSYSRPMALPEKIALSTGQTDSQLRRLSHSPSLILSLSVHPSSWMFPEEKRRLHEMDYLVYMRQSCRKTSSLNNNDHWPTLRWPSSTPRSRWAPRKRQSQAATWSKRSCSWERFLQLHSLEWKVLFHETNSPEWREWS